MNKGRKHSMNTHLGSITIDKDVIARYAGSVAVECFGIVGMAGVNVRDGLVKLLKLNNISRGIVVSVENNKLVLDFHVIVSYGVSILAVSDNLISNVKYKVEEFTGIDIARVNVYVEGVRAID
ncbi:MAG: Asp23/Gls24 family envelope stress response protein [Lachnospiraceae bacterium]|nr:Asp23/Gls24 family envelope stress response protein [Lachnospiraceae bacterium]